MDLYVTGKQSMLGRMQDEDELSDYKEKLRQQQKEQEKLKRQLSKEVRPSLSWATINVLQTK